MQSKRVCESMFHLASHLVRLCALINQESSLLGHVRYPLACRKHSAIPFSCRRGTRRLFPFWHGSHVVDGPRILFMGLEKNQRPSNAQVVDMPSSYLGPLHGRPKLERIPSKYQSAFRTELQSISHRSYYTYRCMDDTCRGYLV